MNRYARQICLPDMGEAGARWPRQGRLPLEPGPLHALMNGTRALPLHA